MGRYHTPPGGGLAPIADEFREQKREQREQARPSGTNIAELVQKVYAALQNINATVVSATTTFLSTGTVSMSNVTVASNVIAGNVTATANIVGNVVKTTTGPTTNITTGRVTGWLQNSDGLIGTATSSERFKTNIFPMRDDPTFDPMAVLELDIAYWQYKAEVAKRDDPTFGDYVGPEYHVGTNFGPIAERAHELGLWMIVVYERESDGVTLKRDDNGEPIPYALHDALFAYLLTMAVQVLAERTNRQATRLDDLAARVAALDGQAE